MRPSGYVVQPRTYDDRTAWYVVPTDRRGYALLDDEPWRMPRVEPFGPYWSYRVAAAEAERLRRLVIQGVPR